jgi:hypothetical protein
MWHHRGARSHQGDAFGSNNVNVSLLWSPLFLSHVDSLYQVFPDILTLGVRPKSSNAPVTAW